MKPPTPLLCCWLAALLLPGPNARAELHINEILFKTPGLDSTSQYIELRGTPNLALPRGTCLVSVEGDANGNPGVVQDVFDLSGRTVGQNGVLVLLQNLHAYRVSAQAAAYANSGPGSGWGHGSGSSIGHRGEDGQTTLEDASATFLLVQTDPLPAIGDDIDTDDDGVPDSAGFAAWTVFDSVGVLDNDGAGDVAYGAINFRRDRAPGGGAIAPNVVVSLPFTPHYLGRAGNSSGSSAADWVASRELDGGPFLWTLPRNSGSSTNTVPTRLGGAALNHIGSPNFGAPDPPLVRMTETFGTTELAESGGTDRYTLGLSVTPSGPVTLGITAGPQLEVSLNGEAGPFRAEQRITLTSIQVRVLTVRALDDDVVGGMPHRSLVRHSVIQSADAARFPVGGLLPELPVAIFDNDSALLSEVKVNPPGTNDVPHEFVEIVGTPGGSLSNVTLLAIDGNRSGNPGTATLAIDLGRHRLGSSGQLVVAAPGHSMAFPAGTTVVLEPQLGAGSGALDNRSLSLLLVTSPNPIVQGADLDAGNNGTLEALAPGTLVLDAVGWTDRAAGDLVYGGVDLTQTGFTPDAAIRFQGNRNARSAGAWFCGDLAGPGGDSLVFDSANVSDNFPRGTWLTPGTRNRIAPRFSPLPPLSHVIGDAGNPAVHFQVYSDETNSAALLVTVNSTNALVVPDANLTVTAGPGDRHTLTLDPSGVGYADIVLSASDGLLTGQAVLRYAASEMGRPGAVWHTGVSDASSAFAVGSDWMFIADDENQSLRLFSRRRSGGPVAAFDMNPPLQLVDLYEDGSPKEVDLEASTHVGERIFWLGSLSNGIEGAARTNRTRIFATDISGSGTNATLRFVGRYDFLKLDLLDWDSRNLHGKGANYYGLLASSADGVDAKAPDGSGFNIEGLCLVPGSTNAAYLCFRAPLVPPHDRACALVLPVSNFVALASGGGGPGSAQFGAPLELNLGCRGIRSIEGDTNGYLIVAGPPGNSPGFGAVGFQLFTWTGQASDPPIQRDADLTGLNVEGIVELPAGPWSASTRVQLISDNGTRVYYGDDVPAKQLTVRNFKKFRSDWVALGEPASAQPVIRSITVSGGEVTLAWCSVAGAVYRVEYTSDPLMEIWVAVEGDVPATGGIARKTFPTPLETQLLYRVVALP